MTADKGFLDKTVLHRQLLEDLRLAGLENRVTHLGSMAALATRLQKEAETSGWSDWRLPAVAEAVYDAIRGLDAVDFTEHWDLRDGGTAAPTFDLGIPFTGHDWYLSSIDGPSELVIDDVPYGDAEVGAPLMST